MWFTVGIGFQNFVGGKLEESVAPNFLIQLFYENKQSKQPIWNIYINDMSAFYAHVNWEFPRNVNAVKGRIKYNSFSNNSKGLEIA